MVGWMVLAACVSGKPPAAATTEPAGAVAPVGGPWVHDLFATHPLVGRIWDVDEARFVDEAGLVRALRTVDHVLLGEKHDNADHHRLQARVVRALAPPVVAFEQLEEGAPVGDATTSAELAQRVGWEESGWPSFDLYAPVFDAVFETGAGVRPAHPTRDTLQVAMRQGIEALPEALTTGLPDVTLTQAHRDDLAEEITEAHCGHATDEVLRWMIRGQQLKDAWMARALATAGPGAVLVAGNGHTRRDRGVPRYLSASTATLSFVEVVEGSHAPSDHQAPADFVWFTPRVDDDDPCERFREQLESMAR